MDYSERVHEKSQEFRLISPTTEQSTSISSIVTTLPKASEKRKAQNRAAQKTYREKRKQRLKELENFAASVKKNKADKNLNVDSKEADNDAVIDSNTLLDNNPMSSHTKANVLLGVGDLMDEYLNQSGRELTAANGLIILNDVMGTSNGSKSLNVLSKERDQNNALLEDKYDPYINHLRIVPQISCVAFFRIACVLGLEDQKCNDAWISKFYQPRSIKGSGYTDMSNDMIVKSTQSNWKHLKPDLRPTKEQILIPHDGYIDLLPWSDVRSNLIGLSHTNPNLFDMEEFWNDIDEQGGLICWGNVSSGSGSSTGSPWDSRSWEARRWFLSKWRFIIGGEDGELARSSAWWREFRGVDQGESF